MIELAKMTKRERTLINIQCDRFFLTINKTKSAHVVFNTIKENLGLPDRFNKELWCFITCVGKSLRVSNKGSQYPLKSTHYTSANKIHNLGLNHKRSSELIKLLDANDWIIFYKGYKDVKNPLNKNRSCILFNDKLVALFNVRLINLYSEPVPPSEMIVIKDSKTKEPFFKLTKFKGVTAHRDLMVDFNKVLRGTDISLMGIHCAVSYKQVFADDLDGAGRVYSFGGFQTIGSSLREYLTLNGDQVTEVDVKGIHPSICRLIQGLPPTERGFDPYQINIDLGVPSKEQRLLCKYATMCMINCKTAYGAAKALINIWEVKEDFPNIKELPIGIARSIISALVLNNDPVVFFGKGSLSWKELQRYDSKVCELVISKFIVKGLPILPWHDSWLCQKQYRVLLEQSIKDSWYEVFNTFDGCELKVEF